MRPRLIALAGSVQSSKIEMRPVFEALGFTFVSANLIGNGLRKQGSDTHHLWADLGLGHCFDDFGRRRIQYYLEMMKRPGLFEEVMRFELPMTLKGLRRQLAEIPADASIVVLWEYIDYLLPSLPFDFTLLFEPNRETWIQRLQTVVFRRGWDGPVPTAEFCDELIASVDLDPRRIRRTIETAMPGKHLVVDTSDNEDRGETALRASIASLNW